MNRGFIALVSVAAALICTPQVQRAQVATVATINQAVAAYTAAHANAPVRVIVQATTPTGAGALQTMIRGQGGRIEGAFSSITGFSATVAPSTANALNHDRRVRRLNLDAPVRWLGGAVDSSQLLNRYEGLEGIPGAWKSGLDGTGVQVAVIDSGVWPHNDLVQPAPGVPGNAGNRVIATYTNPLATDALDHVGHGTHVAGIIAGNGHDSGGQYIGVAPNSLVVSVKIASDLGGATEGDVITGLDWVLQANQHGMHIRVANLSVGSTVSQSYQQSALDAMVEKLWNSGVVVVVAAGNGTGPVTYAPANDPYAITVGSIDDNYTTSLSTSTMAQWALYGQSQDGFNKPEVVADGSHVVSLLAPGSSLSVGHPANIVGTSYFKMGGTSMASPQVAGLVALMLQANPQLNPGQVKRALRRHSTPFGTVAYTSWLGTPGGFIDRSSIGEIESDDNAGIPYSNSYDPLKGSILAGGSWWGDAAFAGAAWNNVSWNNVSWNNVSWNNVSWNSATGNPFQTSTAWYAASWNNVSWNNVSWNNVSWNNVSWNNVSWNNVSWNDATWN
ncbi:MAG: S8 family serine peptidase [Candidatus Dormibacteria bacterium]